MNTDFTFYEFFAGGGLARLGLGAHWRCLFANDISIKKAESYRSNFQPSHEFCLDDIHSVNVDQLPEEATLAWASFPCQDLSVAGNGNGLHAPRSGTFWPFWELILDLNKDGRRVPLIAIENVVGLLTSKNGQDFNLLCQTIADAGYNLGALVVNAEIFVPQSRPRLFLIAVDESWIIPDELLQFAPYGLWFPKALQNAYHRLTSDTKKRWVWWNLPTPQNKVKSLTEIIEKTPTAIEWHSAAETSKLLSMMSETNLTKVRLAQAEETLQIGAIYKRTRMENGKRVQRAEVRFDNKSGCLRTPAGGSSRQILLFVDGKEIRSRLLSPREAARLMGVDDSYILPKRYNDAYHVMGDAVVTTVVAWIEQHILRNLVVAQNQMVKMDEVWQKPQSFLVNY